MTSRNAAATADAFLKSEAEAGRFRGAVLFARSGEVLLRSGYGLANEEWRIPNSPTTKFRIGSVTKTFTAAAISRLVEAGALDLNGQIGEWMGNLPELWQPFTLHQLLTHTTGLRDHLGVPAKRTLNLTGARPVELIKLIAQEPLLFPPGASRSYSNTGYILLGMLIEKVSGRDYARYLEEEIIYPLGLRASGYDSHSQVLPERASGYVRRDGQLQNAEYLDMSVPFAAGGLYSTVDDLLRWSNALHGDGVLQPPSYQRMVAKYPETKKDDGHYGYGLLIGSRAGIQCLSHGGGVNGFLSVVEYDPDLRGCLILLCNMFDPFAFSSALERLSAVLLAAAG